MTTNNQNSNTTGAGLTESLLPGWNTDHGRFNFGDLMILLFDGILLVYTGWRSFDLLSGTVPLGWEVMAFIGLLALDIGAVLWSYIWIFNSTTPWQDKIAMIFFVIDMSGVALTSITDSLLYGDEESVMLAMLEPITMVVIPLIIIANVIAGIVYHFTSADTRARRTKRQLEAKARDEEQRQQDEELQLHYAQQSLLRRQAELPRKIALANLKIAQDQLEKDAMQALFGNGDVERAMGGNLGDNSPSTDSGLADAQAHLLTLQAMGVNVTETSAAKTSATSTGAATESGLGKFSPANWNLFKKAAGDTTAEETLGGDETLADAVADKAYPVYLKTNCPFSFAKIKTDGTDFKVVTHVVGLQFLHANPLSQQARYIVENELTPSIPEADEKGVQTPQGHRTLSYMSNINNANFTGEEYLRISDWNSPVAILPDPTPAGELSA